MRLVPTYPPSRLFLERSANLLVARMKAGEKLVGWSLHNGSVIEAQRKDVIAFALDAGLIRQIGEKPARYDIAPE